MFDFKHLIHIFLWHFHPIFFSQDMYTSMNGVPGGVRVWFVVRTGGCPILPRVWLRLFLAGVTTVRDTVRALLVSFLRAINISIRLVLPQLLHSNIPRQGHSYARSISTMYRICVSIFNFYQIQQYLSVEFNDNT